MAYDIPDEIKYKEKIVWKLDWKQLGYTILFIVLSFLSYNFFQLEGELRLVIPSIIAITGLGFIFLGLEQKIIDRLSYFLNIRSANYNSFKAQKFFEINSMKDNLLWLDDGSRIAIFKVQPINLTLLDSARKKVVLLNYKAFLNQLINPIQILIKTVPIELQNYFETIEEKRTRTDLLELYADFREFEEEKISKKSVKQRNYYVISKYRSDQSQEEINTQLTIIHENLTACGLVCSRLVDSEFSTELTDFLMDYGGETAGESEPESKDEFRNMITPSFRFYQNQGLVNGEYHRIVKAIGYPRKVEDGWLHSFLCKNENYDISIHIQPSSISSTLVYLHNQIMQQTADLILSTAKGTPNPSLEIKKADTMRVYDSLYKGEQKLFRVSTYIDNKADSEKELNLLTEKCKSNLNAQLMIPEAVTWRTAHAIKSTLPLAKDQLDTNREILTDALTATFPFISSGNPNQTGILFAHEIQTLNPIFLDIENQSNKHFFIIGVSGSGKSYAAKYLAIQQLFKEESRLYILDPNGEYKNLCSALKGDVIEISKDSDSLLNLFDLSGDDFGGKMLQLISAFDIIMGGLNESQKAILSDAIFETYSAKGIKANNQETWNGVPPRFSDLRDILQKMRSEFNQLSPQAKSIDALYSRVKMYCENGVFGFLDQDTKIKSDNPVLCFDLSKLPSAVKSLLIFMVLGFIQKQVTKDKESKTVLIDEGWVLLRSKEAEQYILEFIKTSRKFNASIGFITQEVEDLLQSSTGKSILNTASIKILMRQSPSSISLVSNNLRLNEYEENYLLSAKKGHGLIISEDNSYCFFIEASPKVNELITTNPNEKKVETKKKEQEKIQLDMSKGFYLKNTISDKQTAKLMKNGYQLYRTKLTKNGEYESYLVKVRSGEGVEHAFLCWLTESFISKTKLKTKMDITTGPDIQLEYDKKKICFEIETGKRLNYMKREQMRSRFISKNEEFDLVYVIVPNERVARKYQTLCQNIITKSELESAINSIFSQSLYSV